MVQSFFIINYHYYEIPVVLSNCQLIEEKKTVTHTRTGRNDVRLNLIAVSSPNITFKYTGISVKTGREKQPKTQPSVNPYAKHHEET